MNKQRQKHFFHFFFSTIIFQELVEYKNTFYKSNGEYIKETYTHLKETYIQTLILINPNRLQ